MIIKSHIRGGYRSAAEYLKEQGKNEKTRLVEISDPAAKNLNEAFHNMWVVAGGTKCTKPLHHISINPMKDERLTDEQVLAIVQRCEEKYGYKMFHHQRVIVEHIKDGRQHFHVIWNRVSLPTGRPVWPGQHWKKSKQVCREMEVELGLKRPTPRRMKSKWTAAKGKKASPTRTQKYRKTRVMAHSWKTRFKGSAPKRWQPATKSTALRPLVKTAPHTIKVSAVLFDQNVFAALARMAATPTISRADKQTYELEPRPVRPGNSTKGWSQKAVIDWETWGKRNPRRFFALWPELSR